MSARLHYTLARVNPIASSHSTTEESAMLFVTNNTHLVCKMVTVMAEEDVFIGYLQRWQASGRNLVTLPTISEDKIELKLSIVSIDNTKLVFLNRFFYSYEEVMGYYGRLLDRLYDE